MPPPGDVAIGPMHLSDVPAVLAIEQRVQLDPWPADLFVAELSEPARLRYGWVTTARAAGRIAAAERAGEAVPVARCYVVARAGDEVIGHGGVVVTAGEGHVTTLGVDPAWQRRGIGCALTVHLARAARQLGATDLTLEVARSNLPAQRLYRRIGFTAAAIRHGFYTTATPPEDALLMWARDVDADEYAALLEEAARTRIGDGETGSPSPKCDR